MNVHIRDVFYLCANNVNLVTSINLREEAALAIAWRDKMSNRTILIFIYSSVHIIISLF